MPEAIEIELRAPRDADPAKLRETFERELKKQDKQFAIERAEELKPIGMTEAEIIISIAISLGSSAAVHIFRDKIDAAARATGRLLMTDVRVLFRLKKKPKEDDQPTSTSDVATSEGQDEGQS